MPTFVIRGIDSQLWNAVKAKAQQNGISVKQGVIEAITVWAGTWRDDRKQEKP